MREFRDFIGRDFKDLKERAINRLREMFSPYFGSHTDDLIEVFQRKFLVSEDFTLQFLTDFLDTIKDLDPEVVLEVLQEGGISIKTLNLREFRKEVLFRMGMRAFKSLLSAMEVAGVYRPVRFKDPRIYEVIEVLGGWERVFEISVHELRKEFLKLYMHTRGKAQRKILIHSEYVLDDTLEALKGKEDIRALKGKEDIRALKERDYML